MKKLLFTLIACSGIYTCLYAQKIPLDTTHWEITARAHVLEHYKGYDAIYLQAGSMTLKDKEFLNGTIEFDLFLKEEPCFPGVYFRAQEESGDSEQFYVRPHQSGNPDANQVAPATKMITPWQLYFGPRYSFPYDYNFDDWTHVKILVSDDKAQVFLDYAEEPNLSWNLFHAPKSGKVALRGGGSSGIHLANVTINHEAPELKNFNPVEREPIEGLVQTWRVSDKFDEDHLQAIDNLGTLIKDRKWPYEIDIEEGTAANISRVHGRRNQIPGNTVFARIDINSQTDQISLFEFGYSDRVVVILNGKPIYWGNNRWRSRDYRYLGTIGLFDAVYLDLKKGKNELLMAVSEDFGGWLVTGRFKKYEGIKIK